MIKKVVRRMENSETCFACGKMHHDGLNMDFFELEDGTVAGLVTVEERFHGFPGIVHGGIIATLMDEIAARAQLLYESENTSMTLELTTQYKKPVPCCTPLILLGRMVEKGPRINLIAGELILPNGDVAATAQAKFMNVSREKLLTIVSNEESMQVYPKDDDPTEINIPEKA